MTVATTTDQKSRQLDPKPTVTPIPTAKTETSTQNAHPQENAIARPDSPENCAIIANRATVRSKICHFCYFSINFRPKNTRFKNFSLFSDFFSFFNLFQLFQLFQPFFSFFSLFSAFFSFFPAFFPAFFSFFDGGAPILNALYTGNMCNQDVNECSSPLQNTCSQNEHCQNIEGAYICKDICAPNPCHNSATCTPNKSHTEFECKCKFGFEGKFCDIDKNECETVSCKHNAECVNLVGGFECNCKSQRGNIYSGEFCENTCNSNTCPKPSKCKNGVCVKKSNKSTLNPASNYKSTNPCTATNRQSKCKNGASCMKLDETQYRCYCKSGWAGEDCSLAVNKCHTENPCTEDSFGKCQFENDKAPFCKCEPGWTGSSCTVREDPCENLVGTSSKSRKCSNGSKCFPAWNMPGEKYCQCDKNGSFFGQFCENRYKHCSPTHPCYNGGYCDIGDDGRHQCMCKKGFYGENCELDGSKPKPGYRRVAKMSKNDQVSAK